METFKITGTYIWYYFICKREVWLLAHGINADQEEQHMDIGRFIHKTAYDRDRKEIEFSGMKFDLVKNKDGDIIVGEIKKTSKYMKSSKMQLLLYLEELEKTGIHAKGLLLIPEEKTREEVILDDEAKQILSDVKQEILLIAQETIPPKAIKIHYCRSCAYSEMCWA